MSPLSNAVLQPAEGSRAKKTEPTAAIPIAEPTRWPVWSVPAALPPPTTGTWDRVRVRFGAMTRPLPTPARSSGAAIAQATPLPGTKCTANTVAPSPTTTMDSPTTTSGRP